MRGLVVVGVSGRAVPLPVWHAVREALEQVPEQDLDALSVQVIDTAPAAGYLADLVTVEETVTMETPRYADPPWQTAALPAAVPGGTSQLASASRELARNFIRHGGVALPEGMSQDQAVDALVAVAQAAERGLPASRARRAEPLTAGLQAAQASPATRVESTPGRCPAFRLASEWTRSSRSMKPATAQAAIVDLEAGGTMFMIAEPQALDDQRAHPAVRPAWLVVFASGKALPWSPAHLVEAGGTVIQLAHRAAEPATDPATDPASPGDAGGRRAGSRGQGQRKAEGQAAGSGRAGPGRGVRSARSG